MNKVIDKVLAGLETGWNAIDKATEPVLGPVAGVIARKIWKITVNRIPVARVVYRRKPIGEYGFKPIELRVWTNEMFRTILSLTDFDKLVVTMEPHGSWPYSVAIRTESGKLVGYIPETDNEARDNFFRMKAGWKPTVGCWWGDVNHFMIFVK